MRKNETVCTINAMSFFKSKLHNGIYGHMTGYFDVAIEALEKQVPKAPVSTGREIVCPTCRTLVGSSPYCRYCGQALDTVIYSEV